MELITGNILKLHNWPDGKIIGIAKRAAATLSSQGLDREDILSKLDAVRSDPGQFLADARLADLARECIALQPKKVQSEDLLSKPLPYPIWGRENIDEVRIKEEVEIINLYHLIQCCFTALIPRFDA